MNKEIKISFIVAIYNVEKYLLECIESLIGISGDEYEILLIEDGSTDNSAKICDMYAQKDSRIKVFHQKNQGVSVARNVGLKNARGKWICFVDGDDYIKTNEIEKIEIPNELENCDIIYFEYNNLINDIESHLPSTDLNDNQLISGEKLKKIQYTVIDPDYEEYRKYQTVVAFGAPWGKLYKREFLSDNHLEYQPGLIRGQDSLFNAQAILKVQAVAFKKNRIYVYRKNMNSISHKYTSDMPRYIRKLVGEYYKLNLDLTDPFMKQALAARTIRLFYTLVRSTFCNVKNPENYIKRKKVFLKERAYYNEAFKNVKLGKLRLDRKILAFLCKYKIFFVMNFYVRRKM